MLSVGIALAAAAAAQGGAPQSSGSLRWYPAANAKPAEAAKPAAAIPASQPEAAASPTQSATVSAPVTAPPPITATAVASVHKAVALWRNIEDGMSVTQLHALYPPSANVVYKADRTVLADVPVIEGCQAKVNVMHPQGVVKEIVMRGEGSIAGRCSLKLITALSGKYGEPLDKDKVHGSLFGREGKNYIWMHDGVTLQLKRYTNGVLGGGGLFAASWELRYSTADTQIDL